MKINQLGPLVIVGVVVSCTAACSGSPTKPTAMNPSLGEGGSPASVSVSNLNPVGAVDQSCTSQLQTLNGGVDQTGQVPNADAVVTCDSSAGAAPTAEVMVNDAPPMDATSVARRHP